MNCWALIPFKPPHLAKQRLAPVLSPPARRELACSMLRHVVRTLQGTPGIAGVALTSPPGTDQGLARDVLWLTDDAAELNAAVHAAVAALWARGVGAVAVLHSDLPTLAVADVETLLRAGAGSGLALASDRKRQGTNALYLRRGVDWSFQFGPDSFQRHRQQARQRGLKAAAVHSPGLAFDVDLPADLDHWCIPAAHDHPLFHRTDPRSPPWPTPMPVSIASYALP